MTAAVVGVQVGRPSAVDPAGRRALRDAAPFALALIPFAFAIGGTSASIGLSAVEASYGSLVLLAGASQLAAIEVIGTGGSIALTVLIVALINLRFVFYGAGVAGWFRDAPLRHRLLLAVPVVDQTFLLCQERFAAEGDLRWRQRYYLTVSAVLIVAFCGGQAFAFQLGTSLPPELGLHLAAPLAFAGMLAKALRTRADLLAGSVAGITMIGGTPLVGPAALPIAVVAGVAVALHVGGDRS